MYDIFYNFKKATNYNIEVLLSTCTIFLRDNYKKFDNFYAKGDPIDALLFVNLKKFEDEINKVFSLIQQNKSKLGSTEFVEIFEILEELDSRIKTINNLPKWLRCTQDNQSWSNNVSSSFILKQNETIERLTQSLGMELDDWFEVAKQNNLLETGYTIDGGKEIVIKGTLNRFTNLLSSVVDIINGTSIYGKDLDKKISYSDNDLKVLTPEETIQQSVEILITLKKNDNPDEPTVGLQRSIIIGTNKNSLNLPIIIRQMTESFNTDDTLQNFQVTSIKINEDKLEVEIKVESLDSTVYSTSLTF